MAAVKKRRPAKPGKRKLRTGTRATDSKHRRQDEARKAQRLLLDAAKIVKKVSDREAAEILGSGVLDTLLGAILPRKGEVAKDESIYDYLLANKHRAMLVALLRHAITQNYAIEGKVDGITAYVSPAHTQWFDDGVMFLQGKERFSGLIGLYRHGEVRFATITRDAAAGDQLGPNDFEFVSVDEARRSMKGATGKPEDGLARLRDLVDRQVSDESEYQELLCNHPWMLGAQYTAVTGHDRLNDENVPDFTAVRARDGYRDIIELKPPTLKLFGRSDKFLSDFNDAWNQVERYLAFAQAEADYLLRQKGLRFRDPRCWLIIGYRLNNTQRELISRQKEAHNARIALLTYDELLALAEKTLEFFRGLAQQEIAATNSASPANGETEERPAGEGAEP